MRVGDSRLGDVFHVYQFALEQTEKMRTMTTPTAEDKGPQHHRCELHGKRKILALVQGAPEGNLVRGIGRLLRTEYAHADCENAQRET